MKETVTAQSVTQDLEQARLNFVSTLHTITKDVIAGKEALLSDIINIAHRDLIDVPRTYEQVYSYDGTHQVNVEGYVSVLLTTDSETFVTVHVNNRQTPYLLTKASMVKVASGNGINTISVDGIETNGTHVYATFYNSKASLLNETLSTGMGNINNPSYVELTGSLPPGTNILGSMGLTLQNAGNMVTSSLNTNLTQEDVGDPDTYVFETFGRKFNGTGWDKDHNNTQGILLASASRTANVISPTITNFNDKGITVMVNVTAASGTGGLTVNIFGTDPTSNNGYQLLVASAAITADGEYAYTVYPGASGTSPGVKQTSSMPVPREWYVVMVTGDSSSYTYSLGYAGNN